MSGLTWRDYDVFKLSRDRDSHRVIAKKLGIDHSTVTKLLANLPGKVEMTNAILAGLKQAGWGQLTLSRKIKAAAEKARREERLYSPTLKPKWGCDLVDGKIKPDAKRILRLWKLVKRTGNPRKAAKIMGFKGKAYNIYYILRDEWYVDKGCVPRELFDAVRKVIDNNLHPAPQGLRYDQDGNLTTDFKFQGIVRIFRMRGAGMTLDEMAAATGKDRAQVHKMLNNRKYKPFLDRIDPSLWLEAHKVRINGIERMHEVLRQKRVERIAKLRTRLSSGPATSKQLRGLVGLNYGTLLADYLRPMIDRKEIVRTREGQRVTYSLIAS